MLIVRRRSDNPSITTVSDLQIVNVVPDTKLEDEPTEFRRKRKIKEKGKMVESHIKGGGK